MKEADALSQGAAGFTNVIRDGEPKLPKRDWVLLPLICLMTVLVVGISVEAIGTWMVPRQGKPLEDCMVLDDVTTGVRGVPNSVCWNRLLEGPRVENRFNSCGDRAGMECGSKPPGLYRIVMVGSSFVFGLGVAREKTVGAVLPAELSQVTGKRVDLYNEGLEGKFARHIDRHFDQVLAARPDMILWILTPLDVKNASFIKPDPDNPPAVKEAAASAPEPPGLIARVRGTIQEEFRGKSFSTALTDLGDKTRTVFLLRHYLYQSQSLYVARYLMDTDDAGFLRTNPSPEWQSRVDHFDLYFAKIAAQAKAAGVPLVVSLAPNRAQAAMISMKEWPAGDDPYALDRRLSADVTKAGALYVDILPDFQSIPNPEQYYYPTDGHPNAGGHEIIAGLLARKLASGVVPELRTRTANHP